MIAADVATSNEMIWARIELEKAMPDNYELYRNGKKYKDTFESGNWKRRRLDGQVVDRRGLIGLGAMYESRRSCSLIGIPNRMFFGFSSLVSHPSHSLRTHMLRLAEQK